MNRKLWLPLLVVLMVILSSCASDNRNDRQVESLPPAASQPAQRADTPGSGHNVAVGPEQAFDKYMARFPNTSVYKIELEKERGVYVYEVNGFDNETKYELKINPSTGAIIKQETERKDSVKEALQRSDVGKVGALVEKALREVPNAELSEWSLEIKRGKPRLEVEMARVGQKDIEYKYDVQTGRLLEID